MNKEQLDAFLYFEHRLPHVTPEAMEKIVNSLDLNLIDGKNHKWLAMIIRRALGSTIKNITEGPERQSNSETKKKIESIIEQTNEVWENLMGMGHEVDSVLFTYALSRWDGLDGVFEDNGLSFGEPSEYSRFRNAVSELGWISEFLNRAVKQIERDGTRWRESTKKDIRIDRAHILAKIYECAFNQSPTANNFNNGDARHSDPTPFMTFYEKTIILAFNEGETTNYAENVKEALRRHRERPYNFEPDFLPGL